MRAGRDAITDFERKRIIELIELKIGRRDIAKRFNCSRKVIDRVAMSLKPLKITQIKQS